MLGLIGLSGLVAVLMVLVMLGIDQYRARKDSTASTVGKVLDAEAIDLMNEAVRKVRDVFDRARDLEDYEQAITTLKLELSNLVAQKTNRDAEFARERTDIEFKVGLEQKRHEFELEAAKREAILTVREENLSKDMERYAEQAEFERNAMKIEADRMTAQIEKLMESLPDVKALIRVEK